MKLGVTVCFIVMGSAFQLAFAEDDFEFKLGFVKGFALGAKHRANVPEASFLEMETTLTPLFDEYADSAVQHIPDRHRHRRHVHGSNPEPQFDLEDEFLADAVVGTHAGRPDSHLSLPPSRDVKSLAAAALKSHHLVESKAQIMATVDTESLDDDPTTNKSNKTAAEDNARKLAEQEQKIKSLEENYERAQTRLEKYEKQQTAMGAGSGATDPAGKTEFIKGYEGGFKVGYEAGWNMATADLKKRYGFPDRSGHVEAVKNQTVPVVNATDVPGLTNPTPAPVPAAGPPAAPPTNAVAQAPPTVAPKVGLAAMANNMFGDNRNNPFTGDNGLLKPENNPFLRKNNPFFPSPEEEKAPTTLPAQLQPNSQFLPQQLMSPQQYMQPQAQPQPQFAMPPQQQQYLMPQQQQQQQQFFLPPQNGQPMFAENMQSMFGQPQLVQAQQQAPQQEASLPQKAFNFLSNIKGMIQEGKNTVDAVRMALQGQPEPTTGFPQQPQYMPQQQYGQPMQMQMPPQPQFGLQSLMQTGAQTTPPANNDLLSTLAGLLSGNHNANPTPQQVMPAPDMQQDLGLTNLAQLLATTTGTANSALPAPVQATPGADSATLGLQEMQNMIQEGQHA